MSRVLVVEDDPDISEPLVRALRREGYDVTLVTDGSSALASAAAGQTDLLLLDLGLPDMDGLDVCRTLRGQGNLLPVIAIDLPSRRVRVGDLEAALTPKEYELLLMLMRRAGTVVGRDELMREVWRTEWLGATKTLDMHVSTLRRKLGDAGARITTVRGIGFRLDKAV